MRQKGNQVLYLQQLAYLKIKFFFNFSVRQRGIGTAVDALVLRLVFNTMFLWSGWEVFSKMVR